MVIVLILRRNWHNDGSQEDVVVMVTRLRHQLRQEPEDHEALNDLAWILVTSEDDDIRDCTEGLQLATQALMLTKGNNPAILDTLAAAEAADGNYVEAVQKARKGIKLALASGDQQLAKSIRERLRIYEVKTPVRGLRTVPGDAG